MGHGAWGKDRDQGRNSRSHRKLLYVILNEVKNLCGQTNYEILRRPAFSGTPQNDMRKHGFRMDTSEINGNYFMPSLVTASPFFVFTY